jgi:vacuolar protein-sorting-associated protein 4
MKKEDHTISDHDFNQIAKECDNFSGSDINSLVKNACYEPLRRFQKAKYFKQIGTNSSNKPVYVSCAPSDPGAQMIRKEDLSGDQVSKGKITVEDFYKALSNTKSTVGMGDLKKYEEWTKDFGMDG